MLISLRRRVVAESVVSIVDSHTGSSSPRRQKIIGLHLDQDLEASNEPRNGPFACRKGLETPLSPDLASNLP